MNKAINTLTTHKTSFMFNLKPIIERDDGNKKQALAD